MESNKRIIHFNRCADRMRGRLNVNCFSPLSISLPRFRLPLQGEVKVDARPASAPIPPRESQA